MKSTAKEKEAETIWMIYWSHTDYKNPRWEVSLWLSDSEVCVFYHFIMIKHYDELIAEVENKKDACNNNWRMDSYFRKC